jgi:hypothetical protein
MVTCQVEFVSRGEYVKTPTHAPARTYRRPTQMCLPHTSGDARMDVEDGNGNALLGSA